ncbi:restriction endonuclease subunit S [Acinetobacter sp. YH12129]|uniref:restriction endonuclease subunit S n=1 Tax=Acinetobacter sp. YH12129 TaxID=2601114 RepID=UPI0015D17B7D|nr:restriction endonuclease subunit S [Acinetobacter sp. YH12129]
MASPKLRFKEFDRDWKVNTIQRFMDDNFILDQMDGNHGELYPKSEEFSSSGVPYLSATDFSSGAVDFSKCKRLPLERAKLFKKGIAKNGDVLFAHNATVGPVAILETELDFVILSTTATYYRCDGKRLNNRFLKNYFESEFFVQQYFGIMSQSTRNQVPITTQRKLSISIPTIQEQTKIASFLSSVDEKISQLTKKYELLSQYKQGMMQKLFSQQIRFKADDGSEFGEWEIKLIKDIADVKGGKRLPKGYSLINENTGHPYITVGDMNRSYSIDNANIRYVPLEVVDIIKRYTITDKEIFISVAGTLGIIGKIPTELNGANLTENADKLTNLKCHQNFLIYLLDSGYLAELIESTATTSAQPKLALYAIEQMEIQVPCLEEQTKIADFLSAIDQKIEVVAQQIEQAKQWKKGLLQQMFV